MQKKPARKTEENKIIREIKRHTGVLVEQMRHEVKTVAEGHGAIMRKLEKYDGQFAQIGQKLDGHDEKFLAIDRRFDRVEIALLDTNSRVKKIEQKLDTDFNNYGNRIAKLEEKTHA